MTEGKLTYKLVFEILRYLLSPVKTYTYQQSERLSGHRAVDLVLVISAVYTQEDHHQWLKATVQHLDEKLRSLNIGTLTSYPNRYAILQFGGRGFYRMAEFVRLAEGMFFPITSFHLAARQLQRLGAIADGYYALDYAAKYAEFRNDSHVAKMMLLIANKEKNTLVTKSHLTKSQVLGMLSSKNIMLDAAVDIDLSVTSSSGTTTQVFGLNGVNRGITVGKNGTYQTHVGNSTVAQPTSIYNDYITLVIDMEGVACSLTSLASGNDTVVDSFLGAMVFEHSLQGIQQVQVCERCHCGGQDSGGGASDTCGRVTCEEHENQTLCSCLINNPLSFVS